MIKTFFWLSFFILSSCSTVKTVVVTCPITTTPRGAEEIVAKSENGFPVYIGFRGVDYYCTSSGGDIDMEISVNLRAIRKNPIDNDYMPVTISIVSLDVEDKEYDRDDFSYSHFLLKGNKIVERSTDMNVTIPNNGKVYIGIR